ncbi:hypothetical protein L9F63_011500 [Diploptera punctata]|uniref:Uncharacterized protein n=1 Tax=Diploptera punctata TaxID=6984 RepID=A0AAD8AFD8_DIPPU|nr:hypothetical protein L9F63_011500 [Diploptera punctata]
MGEGKGPVIKEDDLEGIIDRNSAQMLEGKHNLPKLDTCIKQLDDILPPGTEDEFTFPVKDESIKLVENIGKKSSMSDEKQNNAHDKKIIHQVKVDKERRDRLNYSDEAFRRKKIADSQDVYGRSNSIDRIIAVSKERESLQSSFKRSSDSRERIRAISKERESSRPSFKRSVSRERKRAISMERESLQPSFKRISDSREKIRAISKERESLRSSFKRSVSRERKRAISKERDSLRPSFKRISDSRERIRAISKDRESSLPSFKRKSDSKERKRAISKDRESPWSSFKRRRSLSREEHKERFSELERNVKSHGRDSLSKYYDTKDYRRSTKVPKYKSRKSIDKEFYGSPISDLDRVSTPTLSSEFSMSSIEMDSRRYGKMRHFTPPHMRSRSRSRSLTLSFSSLSSESPYKERKRKRLPFLKEVEQMFAEMDNKIAKNNQLTTFSFSALYHKSSQGMNAPVSYPPPAMYSNPPVTYPSAEIQQPHPFAPHFAPPMAAPDFSQPFPPNEMPLIPSYLPMAPGPVPPNYIDGSVIQMPGPEGVPMPGPEGMPMPGPEGVPMPGPEAVQIPMQMPPPQFLQHMPAPQMPLPMQSPSAPQYMQLEGPMPPFHLPPPLPVEQQMLHLPPGALGTNPQEVCQIPPPPKLSQLYNDKQSLYSILEESIKVASTRKQMPVNPDLIARCEETLYTIPSNDPPSGPLVLQDSFKYQVDVPNHLKKYQSPLLRKPDIRFNFTNNLLFEEYSAVSSDSAATSAAGVVDDVREENVKQDKHQEETKSHDVNVDSKKPYSNHPDLNVNDSKKAYSNKESNRPDSNVNDSKKPYSIKESNRPGSSGKDGDRYSSRDSKKPDIQEQKPCKACLARADKIMIWNATQTEIKVKSVGIQVSPNDLDYASSRSQMFKRSGLDRDNDVPKSDKNLNTKEEIYRFFHDLEASLGSSPSPSAMEDSSYMKLRQPSTSKLYSSPSFNVFSSSTSEGNSKVI